MEQDTKSPDAVPSAEPEKKKKSGSWGGELWEIAKILLIAFGIAFLVRYFIAQPFIVRGASMEPNFEDSQYLIVDEFSYYIQAPKREETIVFHYPQNPTQFFIKRIIGLPGETVTIKNGDVVITNKQYPDGFHLDQPYLSEQNKLARPDMTITLKADEYFVMGDNRNFSSDSRSWGPLKRSLIVGRVVFRAWPVDKFGGIPNYSVNY